MHELINAAAAEVYANEKKDVRSHGSLTDI